MLKWITRFLLIMWKFDLVQGSKFKVESIEFNKSQILLFSDSRNLKLKLSAELVLRQLQSIRIDVMRLLHDRYLRGNIRKT